MQTSVSTLVSLVLLVLQPVCCAWDVTIASGFADTDAFKTYSFSTAQRCYALTACWGQKTRAARWSDIPSTAEIAFYSDLECQVGGDRLVVNKKKSSGVVDFAGTDLKGNVSSVMIWQSGQYATAGFTSICDESALVLTADQMNLLAARMASSSSNSGEDVEGDKMAL